MTIFSLLNPVQVEKAEHPPLVLDASLKEFKANKEDIKIFLRFMLGENDLEDTLVTSVQISKQATSEKRSALHKKKDSVTRF